MLASWSPVPDPKKQLICKFPGLPILNMNLRFPFRVIQREYDDFEFLQHVLTSSYDVTGVIVPPLPPRPALDPSAAEARARRQLGQVR